MNNECHSNNIMNPEQSAVSKTSSHAFDTDANILLVQGRTELLDNLFPMWDQFSNQITLPSIFYQLSLLYHIYQTFVLSFWPLCSPMVKSSKADYKYLQILSTVAFITPTQSSQIIIFLTHTALFVIVLGLLIFNSVYFHQTRSFVKWIMYPSKFFIEVIPPIILAPIADFFGRTFLSAYHTGYDAFKTAALIFLAIYFIFFSFLYVRSGSILAFSAYLPNHALSTFHFAAHSMVTVTNPLFITLMSVFQIYERWTDILLIVFHIALVASALYQIYYLPFLHLVTNNLYLSSLTLSLLLDLLTIFSQFFKTPDHFLIIFSACVLIISYVAFHFLNKKRLSSLSKLLSYNLDKNAAEEDSSDDVEDVVLTEDQKLERFRQLKLDQSPAKARMYLQYGLARICDLFTDFSLPKFVIDSYTSTQLLTFCIRLIDFFPTEVRLMNLLLSIAMKRRDLRPCDRFLIFQTSKIKILRQSSSSHASNQKLAEMKQATRECENSMRAFWSRSDANVSLLHELYTVTQSGRSMWQEAVRDYPNSSIHHEEFCSFLIECATDFEAAVLMKHKSEAIETGANYSVDFCFRSLIRGFPDYLKKKVLDLKGNLVKSRGRKKGSHSSNKTGNSFSSLSNVVDARMEEEIGRTILLQAKMRLALQHATAGRKATNSTRLSAYSAFSIVFCLALLTVMYILFNSYFSGRYSATTRNLEQTSIRFHYMASTLFALMRFGEENSMVPGLINVHSGMDDIYAFEDKSTFFFNMSMTTPNLIMDANVASRDHYSTFLIDIAAMSTNGESIENLNKVMVDDTVTMVYCSGGTKASERKVNFKEALVFEYMMQAMLAGETTVDPWFDASSRFCTLIYEFEHISNATDVIRTALTNDQLKTAESTSNVFTNMMIYIPIGMFIIAIVPSIIFQFLLIQELKRFAKMLLSIDHEYKQAAASPIRKNCVDDQTTTHVHDTPRDSHRIAFHITLIIVLFIFVIVSVIGTILLANSLNSSYRTVGTWASVSAPRSAIATETLLCLFMGIVRQNPSISSSFPSAQFYFDRAQKLVDTLEAMKEELSMDTALADSILGFDTVLDSILVDESCEEGHSTGLLHDMYECASANQLQTLFRNLVVEAIAKQSTYNGIVNSEVTSNLFHLLVAHLLPKYDQVDKRMDVLMESYESDFKNNILALYLAGIVATFILCWSCFAYINYLDSAFDSALTLLRRVPPAGIVASSNLIEYLMNRTREANNEELTISRAIIRNSADGIFCLGMSGIIESVNPSVSHILGYSPEQLLGQYVGIVLDDSEKEKIEGQMKLIIQKQSAATYEDHIICISDNDSRIPCHAIILGMTNGNSEDVESFVMIIRNEEELVRQRQEAEDAKEQSEKLLYQILPRDIVVRLNQGERDVSFSVPSATIMFIDIVKFSEYTASLTPQEIMSYLSTLFGAFDDCLAKYPLLTKIKLIGDVYMCAGGLFTPDEPANLHAEQMIRFGLDALQLLEETNIKLNANLNVRIGVNTGGPLIAGVLGTDKPVFDIIGDPINIASRLQSTDVPGRIQISQQTYDLVADVADFEIEQRGEVFLKGKGKTQAYLVRPAHSFAFQLSGASNTAHSFVSAHTDSAVKNKN